jgi:predicted phage terminase large subunit-like protein
MTVRRLHSVLRSHLPSFIRKVFGTVSPGETFLPNWHIEAIAYQLEQIVAGRTRRLIINQPPRSLKSISVSVAFVAWLLGRDPTLRIIVASYSAEFAIELHRQFRMVIESDWYRQLFPGTRWVKETGLELVTTKGGSRYAVSVGGSLTGRGGDLIIVDDPLNAAEAQSEAARKKTIGWFTGSLLQRLNDKGQTPVIVMAQRLHEDDLPGHLLRTSEWKLLSLAAIATDHERIEVREGVFHRRAPGEVLQPERESRETLERIRRDIGSLQFSAQYQQQPVPAEGNLVRREWFRQYDALPSHTATTRLVQSWDVAAAIGDSNDYSVCTTWLVSAGQFYVVDVFRARLEYPALRRKVIELAERFSPQTILIEDAGFGLSLLQDLRTNLPAHMTQPLGVKPVGTKSERLVAQTAKIEAGHVHLPKEAPWLSDFLNEMLAFPNGRHDDQVDSVSQFLNWVQGFLRYTEVIAVAPIVFSGEPRPSWWGDWRGMI